jgi:FixJ family two-component response regulator
VVPRVPPLVVVVDDNESVRDSLPRLLRQCGFDSVAYASAEDFLRSEVPGRISCLILDIAMPGMSGVELQRELARRRQGLPIIFITGHAGNIDRRGLLEDGAVECLFKPFSDTRLLDAVAAALGATPSSNRPGHPI